MTDPILPAERQALPFADDMSVDRPRLLVVDDSPETQRALNEDFSALGCQVFVVSTAEDALEQLEGGLEVDVIILDFQLPGMDGPTFFHHLRANKNFHTLGVVPFSSLVHEGFHSIASTVLQWAADQFRHDKYSLPMVAKPPEVGGHVSFAPPKLILTVAHALANQRVGLPDPYRNVMRKILRDLFAHRAG